ncbi:hypothetical protein B0H16DRAFT_368836 [Mycena metata]|uniref:Uncharacterized protein n=1 Tax=Mycena metata TaxID=1033252 RepID=A0AAD7JMU1_9AGAR|nr:hypothetical protein B0H16DRAFT_368836 [Mycena metata]
MEFGLRALAERNSSDQPGHLSSHWDIAVVVALPSPSGPSGPDHWHRILPLSEKACTTTESSLSGRRISRRKTKEDPNSCRLFSQRLACPSTSRRINWLERRDNHFSITNPSGKLVHLSFAFLCHSTKLLCRDPPPNLRVLPSNLTRPVDSFYHSPAPSIAVITLRLLARFTRRYIGSPKHDVHTLMSIPLASSKNIRTFMI